MTYFHAFLEIIGVLSILLALLMVTGAYCIGGRRNSLDRFKENPFEPRFSKIRELPNRLCPGKPRGKL